LRAQVGGWKGAAIGSVTGAAAGGVAGHLLDKQAAELKKKDIAATANGILVHLKNELLFETDSAVLKP
jgi:outer membrane lipoprotein SlyB